MAIIGGIPHFQTYQIMIMTNYDTTNCRIKPSSVIRIIPHLLVAPLWLLRLSVATLQWIWVLFCRNIGIIGPISCCLNVLPHFSKAQSIDFAAIYGKMPAGQAHLLHYLNICCASDQKCGKALMSLVAVAPRVVVWSGSLHPDRVLGMFRSQDQLWKNPRNSLYGFADVAPFGWSSFSLKIAVLWWNSSFSDTPMFPLFEQSCAGIRYTQIYIYIIIYI